MPDLARDYRDVGKRVSNWGRWGPEDERGTLNLITPERIAAAAQLVRRGAVFELGIPLDSTGPQALAGRMNPVRLMSESGADQDYPGGIKWADDYVFMPLQAGSQWDAFGHVWYDGQLYNGFAESEISPHGAKRCSITAFTKGIVGRGVLVDLARMMGVDWIQGGYVITPADLDAAILAQGVELLPGDILLVRTGWRKKFVDEGDAATWMAEEPGLGMEAMQWVRDKDLGALCMDNWGIEVIPNEDPVITNPVHCVLLRDIGIPLGEILDFEELADDCASDGVYEFLFCGPPLKFTGAVGSPVNPVVIK
ncbi:MAG: cyclase family protein [Actinomycetota bacterium]|nr:cyclase family protein [Actinomycetota bacterium]